MNTIIIFTVLTIINVIFSTIKSIVTIKSGKLLASIISAGYYGYYNIILIYTVADFPLWQKILVTFFCNLVGVFMVKFIEEKTEKEKLWKIEATILKNEKWESAVKTLKEKNIPCMYIYLDKYVLLNCYCSTKEQSSIVKKELKKYNAKYFAIENKNF